MYKVKLTSDLEKDPSLSTQTNSMSKSSSSTSIPPPFPALETAHAKPNLAVAFTSSSIVGSTTRLEPELAGRIAKATAIGIADKAREPAERIERAVALIPLARDENGIDVVGAGFWAIED